jgi:predicted AlkP superfamily pyrophosphatase or phosphodiesterase
MYEAVGRFVSRFAAILVYATATLAVAHAAEPPRLVLQITVDQLRGDMLPRYRDRLGTDGFRRLLDGGVWYTNANYGTSNTFTASGHAVLVTGADTAEHGMVGNYWFDRTLGKRVTSVFDPEFVASPRSLLSTTIGDEIVSGLQGSRAFAVAGKDRSAIIPAGRRGRAYWYSDETGAFGASAYYGKDVARWVKAWNDAKPADRYSGRSWTPLDASRAAGTSDESTNRYAVPYPGLGKSFPHPLPDRRDAKFYEALPETPFIDELMLDFSRELVTRENLGGGPSTDYLSISLSAVDYVGHAYGPNSAEYADTIVRLDAVLGRFLEFIDQRVGIGRTLIVLSADHGVDEIPEVRAAQGYDAGRLYPDKILERENSALKARFKVNDALVAAFVPPGAYLDRAKIAALGLDASSVESALAEELRGVPGIAYAITRSDLMTGNVPQTALMRQVQRGFYAARSGDVVIVQKQFWFMYVDPECCAAMHGSPYLYDTFVPVVFAGNGLGPAKIARPVEPASIAPTIAAILGITAPSGSSAPVLTEVVDRR